jgi:hypothetical protein
MLECKQVEEHFAAPPRAAVLPSATRLREGAPRWHTRVRARVVRLRLAPCAAACALCESKTLPAAGVPHTRRGCTLPWRMPRTWRRLLAALGARRVAHAQTLP